MVPAPDAARWNAVTAAVGPVTVSRCRSQSLCGSRNGARSATCRGTAGAISWARRLADTAKLSPIAPSAAARLDVGPCGPRPADAACRRSPRKASSASAARTSIRARRCFGKVAMISLPVRPRLQLLQTFHMASEAKIRLSNQGSIKSPLGDAGLVARHQQSALIQSGYSRAQAPRLADQAARQRASYGIEPTCPRGSETDRCIQELKRRSRRSGRSNGSETLASGTQTQRTCWLHGKTLLRAVAR